MNRSKVREGAYKVGDKIEGKQITGFGKSWNVYVDSESACIYGLGPDMEEYPTLKFQYAYFS